MTNRRQPSRFRRICARSGRLLRSRPMAPPPRLAFRTDVLVQPAGTLHERRTDHVVRRTLERPGYQDGNQLVLDEAPAPHELERWIRRHFETFPDPRVGHAVLSWETPPGAPGHHEVEGYERDVVLVADELDAGPAEPPGVPVRRIETDEEWDLLVEHTCDVLETSLDSSLGAFTRWRTNERRRSLAERPGGFWGAFHSGELVASLGLFLDAEHSRYQDVQTRRDHRRRGLASRLLRTAAEAARRTFPGTQLVIVAEEGGDADRLYRKVGFRPVGLQHTLRRRRYRRLASQSRPFSDPE